ncbi:recombinase XerS [Streptococcus sp. NM]|uniref:tyrosine-type recombinase/integrase n=1 Tax=Streptococcus sp. NM TaxID=2292266 RepID=UPI000E274A5E|nr:tyrosine-type recombinase/integrase [Streptococcus sp. NM]REK92266.1 recombinase XerS [Streptococcus sp. NM]REK92277.1 recombinase XerS [Streptococcus sp. NM]
MTKLEKKYDELEGFWSPAVRLYIDYFFTTNKRDLYSYRKLNSLKKFLDFYAGNHLKKSTNELTMDDLEQTPVEVVADYVNSLELKPDGKKRFISVLNSFWNYYTVVSFSGDRKAPHFYRNVMDEWINEYGILSLFTSKRGAGNTVRVVHYDLPHMLYFFDEIDKNEKPTSPYDFFLDLDEEAGSSKLLKNKDRDLAIIALLAGTGVDLKQLAQTTYRDIDLHKQTLIVTSPKGERIKKPILSEFIHYISPYIKEREKIASTNASDSLFLDFKRRPLTAPKISGVISRIERIFEKSLSAAILKQTHSCILLEKNKDFLDLIQREK